MRFEEAIEIVLKSEGGFVNDPKDPGGTTNFGISQRAYPQLNIAQLSKEKAIEIYRKDYWEKNKIDSMPDKIRLAVFDCCVNQGADFAIKTLQGICGVEKDGLIGPKTLEQLNRLDSSKVLQMFCDERLKRYGANINFYRYGLGWTRRLLEVAFRV